MLPEYNKELMQEIKQLRQDNAWLKIENEDLKKQLKAISTTRVLTPVIKKEAVSPN